MAEKTDTTDHQKSVFLSDSFPISYISVVGVHISLWTFAALCLPRTSFLFTFTTPEWDPVQLSSRDHPQHPFFEALTLSPTHTLAWLTVGAAFLQSWWAGWLRQWWLEIVIQGSDSERKIGRARYEHQKFQAFKHAWLATLTASVAAHVLIVLFGAPITSYVIKTYLLALLISIMTVYCPAFVIGDPLHVTSPSTVRQTWARLFVEFSADNTVERTMVYQAIGTIFGSWLGNIPIALDWDRPWQAWPLAPAFCAIGGYILSSLVVLTLNVSMPIIQETSRVDIIHYKAD